MIVTSLPKSASSDAHIDCDVTLRLITSATSYALNQKQPVEFLSHKERSTHPGTWHRNFRATLETHKRGIKWTIHTRNSEGLGSEFKMEHQCIPAAVLHSVQYWQCLYWAKITLTQSQTSQCHSIVTKLRPTRYANNYRKKPSLKNKMFTGQNCSRSWLGQVSWKMSISDSRMIQDRQKRLKNVTCSTTYILVKPSSLL